MKDILCVMNEVTHYNVDMLNKLAKNNNLTVVFLKTKNDYGFLAHKNDKYGDLYFNHFTIKTGTDAIRLFKLVIFKKYDVYLSWGYFPYVKIFLTLIQYFRCKNRLVFCDSFPQKPGVIGKTKNFARRQVLKLFSNYLVSGKQARDEALQTGLDPSKIKIFCYHSDLPPTNINFPVSAAFEKSKGVLTVFVSSQLVERKGLDTLLKALAKLNAGRYKCVIEGVGPLQSHLQQMVSELRLGKVVKFIGYSDLGLHYKNILEADVICVPSKYDPWSIVVDEGLALGKVVVASSKVGCAAHLIQDGYNGFIFEADNANCLADKLDNLYDDKCAFEEIEKNAIYTRRKFTEDFLETCEDLFG